MTEKKKRKPYKKRRPKGTLPEIKEVRPPRDDYPQHCEKHSDILHKHLASTEVIDLSRFQDNDIWKEI